VSKSSTLHNSTKIRYPCRMKTKPLTSFFSTQATLQLPNHVRELIELLKPKKVCVQHVYNTSD